MDQFGLILNFISNVEPWQDVPATEPDKIRFSSATIDETIDSAKALEIPNSDSEREPNIVRVCLHKPGELCRF